MKPRPYIILLAPRSEKDRLDPARLQEIKRILGEQTTPLMAADRFAAIAFMSTKPATDLIKLTQPACGRECQILVTELGKDQSAYGLPQHHKWFHQLRWMSGP